MQSQARYRFDVFENEGIDAKMEAVNVNLGETDFYFDNLKHKSVLMADHMDKV